MRAAPDLRRRTNRKSSPERLLQGRSRGIRTRMGTQGSRPVERAVGAEGTRRTPPGVRFGRQRGPKSRLTCKEAHRPSRRSPSPPKLTECPCSCDRILHDTERRYR